MTDQAKPTPGAGLSVPGPLRLHNVHADMVMNMVGIKVAECISPEDAAHIVKCVNAHDGLLKTVVSMKEEINTLNRYRDYVQMNLERIERDGWTPVSYPEFVDSEEATLKAIEGSN